MLLSDVDFFLVDVSAETPYYPAVTVHAKGCGSATQRTVFNWSLAIPCICASWWIKVLIKSLKLILLLGFVFISCHERNWQHALNYKLKRLSFSILICRTQNKIFKGGLAVVSFSSSWFDVKAKLQEPDFEACSSART